MVSVKEKGPARRDQVWIKEMSESEPLLRCRNSKDKVKTGLLCLVQDEFRRNLFTAYSASGVKVA